MRTNVYIDAFNLYYGAVRGTPYKWLDLAALCRAMLPGDHVHRIRYFTAKVGARPGDPAAGQRQQVYFRALRTIPNLSIHEGHFLVHPVRMPMADDPTIMVRVLKTEEKGSDVNLATELLVDAFRGDFEAAAIVSNDSDLVRPIQVVRNDLGKTAGILCPHRRGRHPSQPLRKTASFLKEIRESTLARCQFPETLQDGKGFFHRPYSW